MDAAVLKISSAPEKGYSWTNRSLLRAKSHRNWLGPTLWPFPNCSCVLKPFG